MTIHMIQFQCGGGTNSFLTDSYIPQWLINHQAWSDTENDPPELIEPAESVDVARYWAEWRFDWSESKSVLLDNLWGYTTAYADWAYLQYHECDHDTGGRSGCEWDDHRETGTIPETVRS